VQQKHGLVISEEDLRYYNPEGGYGWAKLLGEIQLSWMKNVDVSIARIFTAYGPGEPLDETAHAVPALIRKAIMYPKEEFVVWGCGDQTRSFMYVSDCVEALIRLEKKASNPPIVVNVGSDEEVPIKKVAEKIIQISGKQIEIKYDPAKLVGPLSRTADIRRAKALLGWQLKISLDEGLKRTYAWAKGRLKIVQKAYLK
jgi:nucleoside-diphosphate-sugar epimerase